MDSTEDRVYPTYSTRSALEFTINSKTSLIYFRSKRAETKARLVNNSTNHTTRIFGGCKVDLYKEMLQ